MSMITEQVEQLRELAKSYDGYIYPSCGKTCKALREAADTIETLSAKVQAANMERSTVYYNGGWIPVKERLPESGQQCLVIDEDGRYGIGFYREDAQAWDSPNWGWLERADKVDNKEIFVMPCGMGKVIAWMPLPEPYREDGDTECCMKK